MRARPDARSTTRQTRLHALAPKRSTNLPKASGCCLTSVRAWCRPSVHRSFRQFWRRSSQQNFRFVEGQRVGKYHASAQVVLHARASQRPGDADCRERSACTAKRVGWAAARPSRLAFSGHREWRNCTPAYRRSRHRPRGSPSASVPTAAGKARPVLNIRIAERSSANDGASLMLMPAGAKLRKRLHQHAIEGPLTQAPADGHDVHGFAPLSVGPELDSPPSHVRFAPSHATGSAADGPPAHESELRPRRRQDSGRRRRVKMTVGQLRAPPAKPQAPAVLPLPGAKGGARSRGLRAATDLCAAKRKGRRRAPGKRKREPDFSMSLRPHLLHEAAAVASLSHG